jgi:hypothetical protein
MRPMMGEKHSDPYGIRTRVTGVKGRCPRPLDEGVREQAFYMVERRPASESARGAAMDFITDS